jgi:glutathione S-transferase
VHDGCGSFSLRKEFLFLRFRPGPESYEQIDALAERGRVRIQHFFAWLDARLAENEFVCGPNFTVADITGLVTVDFPRLGEAQAAGAAKPFATFACDGFRTSERQSLDKGRLRQLQGRVPG